jgi:hypothetical protein
VGAQNVDTDGPEFEQEFMQWKGEEPPRKLKLQLLPENFHGMQILKKSFVHHAAMT